MSDKKITQLNNITGANLVDADEFVVVDISADETKAITLGELKEAFDAGSGFVRVTGDTMTGDLSFGDNDKAIFGAESDLQIYHDGFNSYIDDAGTGQLLIRGRDAIVLEEIDSGDNYIYMQRNNKVELYYSGAPKLATTSTGVDVTGTITSDGLTVDGQSVVNKNYTFQTANYHVKLGENSGDSYIGSFGNGHFIASGYYYGSGLYQLTGGTTNLTGYAATSDFTIFAEDNLTANALASAKNRLKIDGATGDISFYEDTGTTPKFFWDASAESLGIGTTAPEEALDLGGAGWLKVGRGAGYEGGIFFRHTSASASSRNWSIRNDVIGYGDFAISQSNTQNGDVTASGTSTTRFLIDSSGNVGIGTSSPLGNLQIQSSNPDVYITSADTGQSDIYFGGTTAPTKGRIQYSDNSDMMAFWTDASEAMRITADGKVGIGTTTPDGNSNVQIQNDTGNALLRLRSSTTGLSGVDFGDSGDIDIGGIRYNNSSNYMYFNTNASEAMRIDSSGNVGIGGASTAAALETRGNDYSFRGFDAAGNFGLQIYHDGAAGISKLRQTNSGGDLMLEAGTSSGLLFFNTAGAEAMRIDASGRILASGTSTNVASDTTGSQFTYDGSSNFLAVKRENASSAAAVAYFNRTGGHDGSIVAFRKDGSTVGSIAAGAGGFLTIGSPNGTPVYATFANGSLKPTTSLGSNSDGSGDLGNTSSRWKDLYLSGGVHLGGTGAANKLDDYETGQFNAHIYDDSGQITSHTGQANYVKIGEICHLTIEIYANGVASTSVDGKAWINIPFVGQARTNAIFLPHYYNGTGSINSGYINGPFQRLYLTSNRDEPFGNNVGGTTIGGTMRLYGSLTYRTA